MFEIQDFSALIFLGGLFAFVAAIIIIDRVLKRKTK